MSNKRTQTWEEAHRELGEIKKITSEIKLFYTAITNNSSEEEKKGWYEKIEDKYVELLGEDGKSGKVKELLDFYELIIGSEDGYKKLIEDFFDGTEDSDDFETRKENLARLEQAMFGKNLGTEEELPGLESRLEQLFSSNEKKYKDFYDKINKELTAGTTSVALASVFEKKSKYYYKERLFWSCILLAGIFFIVNDFYKTSGLITTWDSLWVYLIKHIPLVIFVSWALLFISNRQAEARKLEESYGHKESMARAYFGYKDTIKELDAGGDGELTKKHMENLLEAMKEDSSKFLSNKGESHPLYEVFTKFLDKSGGKISVGDLTIESK